MKARKLLLISLVFVYGLCHAQVEQPTISADRPGALTGTDVMPLHKLQWETGVGFESTTDGPHVLTLNNTLLRFGLFENAELRVGTDFLMWNDGQAMEPTFGFAPLTVGMKTRFYEGEGFLPSVAWLIN